MSSRDLFDAIDSHLRTNGPTPPPDLRDHEAAEEAPSPLDQRAGHVYHTAIAWAANREATPAARSHAKRAAYTSPELAALHAHDYALAQRAPVSVALPQRVRREDQYTRDTLLLALLVCIGGLVALGAVVLLGYALTALRDAPTLVP